MRSLIITFFLFIHLGVNVSAQAQFETPFYFEDAAGNRDTVIIGADTSANQLVNTHLGEILITSPWDSVFEVRVAREDNYHDFLWFGDSLYLYNKRITYLFEVPECGYSTWVIFLMYTMHFPVTVTWDTAVWSFSNSPCPIDGSFFHHTDDVLEPNWWPFYNYACLGPRSSYEFDITNNEPYSGIVDSVSGIGMEFIYGLQLNVSELENPTSPCYLDVGVIDPFNNEQFIVYPNPSHGKVSIQFEDDSDFRNAILCVRNYQGIEVLKTSEFRNTTLELSYLPNGLYFISFLNGVNHLITTEKIIISK